MSSRSRNKRLAVFFALSLIISFGMCAGGVVSQIAGATDKFHTYLTGFFFWYAWIALIGLIVALIRLNQSE